MGGEQAEAAFLNKATSLGLNVARPWGDSERYDFIVDSGRRLLRVQVKSTQYVSPERFGFLINMACRAAPYTEEDIDFLVAYIVPLNLWYVIPIKACLNRTNLVFYPQSKNSRGRYEKVSRSLVAAAEQKSGGSQVATCHPERSIMFAGMLRSLPVFVFRTRGRGFSDTTPQLSS